VDLDAHLIASIFEARKKKRGDISGSRLNKGSTQRIIAQFGELPNKGEYRSRRGVERTPQALQEADVAQNNAWVRISTCCPYYLLTSPPGGKSAFVNMGPKWQE